MGTNFYLHKEPCNHCERGESPLHIGKSSSGWVFSLHIIPERGINNLYDWIVVLLKPDLTIRDEYDRTVTFEELLKTITCRTHINGLNRHDHANNLVSHGHGTWDCIKGEFS